MNINELSADRISAIKEHYERAQRKHPYFADYFSSFDDWAVDGKHDEIARVFAQKQLAYARCNLNVGVRNGTLSTNSVLACEMSEIFEAWTCGDKTQTVQECYDAIAVLLRMIDVIEGLQKLGKPEQEQEPGK